nr:transporter substrate-binding domain-containing protein [Dichelobacter nodosus]
MVSCRQNSTHEKILQVSGKDSTAILGEKSNFLAVKDVLQGKVVTSIGDDSYIFGFFENYKNEGIQLVVDPYHEKKHYAIVIKKGNTELKNP